jgi:hypothetical protein
MMTPADETLALPDSDALFGLDVAGTVTAAEVLPHFDKPPQDIVGASRLADGRLFVAHLIQSVIFPPYQIRSRPPS